MSEYFLEYMLTWLAGVDSVIDDSRSDPSSAPEACEQASHHGRDPTWLATGACCQAFQRLPEMCPRRRAPGLRSDGELSRRAHAPVVAGSRRRSDPLRI